MPKKWKLKRDAKAAAEKAAVGAMSTENTPLVASSLPAKLDYEFPLGYEHPPAPNSTPAPATSTPAPTKQQASAWPWPKRDEK